MGISEEELRHVARVARIDLTDEEVAKFVKQVNDIIAWFQEVGSVNTENIVPSFHPLKTENVFRRDEPKACLSQDESLSNTEHKEKGYFKGPRAV